MAKEWRMLPRFRDGTASPPGRSGHHSTSGVLRPIARVAKGNRCGNPLCNGPRTMAEGGLDHRGQLSERAVVFGDLEQRIVAESPVTGWFQANSTVAGTDALGSNAAHGIGQHQMANIMGRAALERSATKLIEQLGVVRRVRGALARKAGRKNSRSPASASTTRPLSSPSTQVFSFRACSTALSVAFAANESPVSSTSIACG